MLKFILSLILYFSASALFAQVQWAHQIKSDLTDNLEGHIVDTEGNIIVVGHFEGTTKIGSFTLTNQEATDIFIYKATQGGDVLWAKTLKGPSYGGDAGLSTDKYGNIYVTGGFIQELIIDGISVLKGNSYWNTFLAKFDKEGQLLWVKGITGSTSLSEAKGFGVIAANDGGEVVISVNVSGAVSIGAGMEVTSGSASANNLLLVKYTAVGSITWYRQPIGSSNTVVKDIWLDNNGEAYFTGSYTGTVSFGTSILKASAEGHGDIFLAKQAANGDFLWAKSINKTSALQLNNSGQAMAVDPVTKDIYLAGNFKGNIRLDNQVITSVNTSEDPASADIFLARYSATGTLEWAKRLGTDGHDFVRDIQLKEGRIAVAGAWNFMPFFQTYDTTGKLQTEVKLATAGWANSISIVNAQEFYLGGLFFGTFKEENVLDWIAAGQSDGFLLKLGGCSGNNLPVPVLSYNCNSIKVDNFSFGQRVKWYRNDVEIAGKQDSELISPESGNYTVSYENGCGISFSASVTFNKETFLPERPQLEYACKTIKVLNPGGNRIAWYRNGQLLPGENKTELPVTVAGEYTVAFRNDCGETAAKIKVGLTNKSNYASYNVITPNGDGKNEFFVVDAALVGSRLQVFNRWGTEVFNAERYQNDWNGSGLAAGVYFWAITNDCKEQLKGSVTIIR